MKIVFVDLMCSQPVAGSKFHGGGEFTKTVFREISKYHNDRIMLNVFYNPDLFLDEWIFELIQKKNIANFQVHSYGEVSDLPDFQNADTFFAGLLTGVNTLQFPTQMRVIGVYHGYRSLELPADRYAPLYGSTIKDKVKELIKFVAKKRYFEYKRMQMKSAIEKCTDIIGDSEHSGYATRVFFPKYDYSHVHVFYPPLKFVDKTWLANNIRNDKIILMLGGNRWVKNFYRGAKALDSLFSKNQLSDYTVEVVGGIPNGVQRRIVNKERFVSISYLTPDELEQKYAECDFFFYPTLNEGFGSPPLEAMRYGKTCLVSAVTSLPEIYSDAVYYCNPYDLNEMQSRLLQASENKISVKKVAERYNWLEKRQKEDIEKLCYLILK